MSQPPGAPSNPHVSAAHAPSTLAETRDQLAARLETASRLLAIPLQVHTTPSPSPATGPVEHAVLAQHMYQFLPTQYHFAMPLVPAHAPHLTQHHMLHSQLTFQPSPAQLTALSPNNTPTSGDPVLGGAPPQTPNITGLDASAKRKASLADSNASEPPPRGQVADVGSGAA